MGGLKRLQDRAVEAGHIHDSVIGTDIALDQSVRDFLCVLDGHRGDSPLSPPAMAGIRIAKGRPPKRAPPEVGDSSRS